MSLFNRINLLRSFAVRALIDPVSTLSGRHQIKAFEQTPQRKSLKPSLVVHQRIHAIPGNFRGGQLRLLLMASMSLQQKRERK
jgi:hypothetical protein